MSKTLLALIALAALAAPLPAQDLPEDVVDPACPADMLCIGRRHPEYSFAFRSPRAAAQYPPLEALLQAEAAAGEAWLGSHTLPPQGQGPPFSYEARWRIDAALPELVAASGAISHYTGGAHGGIEYRTLLVDRRDGRRIALADLFRAETFEDSLFGHRLRGMRAAQANFCRALTAAVRERRDDPAAIVECPRIEDQPVTLLCGPRGRIEALRALLNPDVAGSWAEGPYEVDFPVDAQMMTSMKRRYRPAFGVTGETGSRIPARPCS
jgi:hypothetical protein